MQRPHSVMDVQADYQGRAFTSLLTAHDFWLVLNKGLQPLGMVMGHCLYAMGSLTHAIAIAKGQVPTEVKAYTEFMHHARAVALARMQFEADELGADGVIGVDIEVNYLHNDEWMQVTATGTAVRSMGPDGYKALGEQSQVVAAKQAKGRDRNTRRPQSVMDVQADYRGHAFTSNLSSEELWLMLEAGYQPLGIIISNGVSAMGQSTYWEMIFKTNFRTEVPRKFGVARGVAYDSMFAQARELGADTIIGVQYKKMFKLHYHNQWLECFIMGTALRYVGQRASPKKPKRLKEPLLMLEQATSQSHERQQTPKQHTWPCGHTNRSGAHFCSICGEVSSLPAGR